MKGGHIPSSCPSCGHHAVTEIVYGKLLLTEKLQADLRAGKILLGERFFSEDSPWWRCTKCGDEGGRVWKG